MSMVIEILADDSEVLRGVRVNEGNARNLMSRNRFRYEAAPYHILHEGSGGRVRLSAGARWQDHRLPDGQGLAMLSDTRKCPLGANAARKEAFMLFAATPWLSANRRR
jgi:hypothetical protein